MSKIKIKRDLTPFLKQAERDLVEVRSVFLSKVAEETVSRSPVDTGAYVTSHTITTGSGNGRMRTSDGKPSRNEAEAKEEALAQLQSDIEQLPDSFTKVYINNRSPHNKFVEYGGKGWKTAPYRVYAVVRDLMPNLLQEAIDEVKRRK